jgi:hypothetical protein
MTKSSIWRALLKVAAGASLAILGLLPAGSAADDLKITVHVKAQDPAGGR